MTPSNTRIGDHSLTARLQRELEGEVLFDPFSRGRYSTDASIYQIEPIGVVVPRHAQDVVRTIQIAADEQVSVLPRGGGTSQAGQTVGRSLVVDTSKYLTRWSDFDAEQRTIVAEPGVVLDRLNAWLARHELHFPVDVATSSQATIGGMAGNNSSGARSIRYGLMVDNVNSIEAVLANGTQLRFGPVPADLAEVGDGGQEGDSSYRELVRRVRAIYLQEREELEARTPTVLRNVAGYNLHRVSVAGHNMADLLVGSEGTLAFFTRINLALAPLPKHKVLGVCQFPTLNGAVDSVRYIVELGPSAVELVDRTLLHLAHENPGFRASIGRFVRGDPDALLLVEFAGDDGDEQQRQLARLEDLMGSLGYPNRVVSAVDPAFQAEVWSVRKAALNIVMSMKGDRKPVSFIEDCAVPLEHLAEYTDRLSQIFQRHGTSGTWYAHASVGCLHIRPVLDLKSASDVAKMRTIAEEAHDLVTEFTGSHSGEHGDGLVRSEFLRSMLGPEIVGAFDAVKRGFDPVGLFNPGKIVNPPPMDDRSNFRFKPDYAPLAIDTVLDWSEWSGLSGAAEMCNNNGACRKHTTAVMCPSFRVTRDEVHVTRGRANTLRLALTGQLGSDAFTSDEMYQTMDLCIGCKACRRECPTGVDMARMKVEFLHHYYQKRRIPHRKRLIAYLPRYAPRLARLAPVANVANRFAAFSGASRPFLGFSSKRQLPPWRRDVFREDETPQSTKDRDVVLFVDTFNRHFEPENVRAARSVLEAAGYRVAFPRTPDGERPLCCGRTFLNAGLVQEARTEAQRASAALAPHVEQGTPIVGLEPSCLLTLRDEFTVLLPHEETVDLAHAALLFEEFLAAEEAEGRLELDLRSLPAARVLVHGHCHQKAFGAMQSVEDVLRLIPDLTVDVIDAGCCGMAGSFGYEAEHYDLSMQMAELGLLPAVRSADEQTWIVADGTSCRRQILDGAQREALHVARVLEAALVAHGAGSR
jgi:FAD/FMN-containing dehydrogenase/Fe-S oxidoreductase